jgi:hypothetical protein
LNFLDTNAAIPKHRSRILIGSCEQSIELDDQDVSSGTLGGLYVAEGKLFLHFLHCKEMEGSPTAVVSVGHTKLLFKD